MNKIVFIFFILFLCKAEAQEPSALQIGDSLYAIGDYGKAIKAYKNAAQNTSQKIKLAKSYEAAGNATLALNYYKLVLVKDTSAIVIKYNYGKLLATAGRLQQADSVFTKLNKSYPGNSNFVYQLATVKEEMKDSTAQTLFAKAYFLDNTNLNALYKLTRHAVTKRNFGFAQNYVEKALVLDPNSTRFLTLKALSHFYLKEYHEAVKTYEQLLELNQSNEQLHEKLAISYTNTNQFEKAIDQYTILINEYSDKIPSYHSNLARAYIAIKEYEKAIRHIEIAIVLQDIPLDGEYLQLSTIYKKQGNDKLVFEMMRKAVQENPEDEMLQYFQVLAADNYFKDKTSILNYYERYLERFGAKGRYRDVAKQRVRDLKKELHFEKE